MNNMNKGCNQSHLITVYKTSSKQQKISGYFRVDGIQRSLYLTVVIASFMTMMKNLLYIIYDIIIGYKVPSCYKT